MQRLNLMAGLWAIPTYVLCWLWLGAHVNWSRKCGPDPAFNYPHLLATCQDMLALRAFWAGPAIVALLVLTVLFGIAASRRAPTSRPRNSFWSSPLAALGGAAVLWGGFFGSLWLIYWLDHRRTCTDMNGPLFHAPYCADLDRALWEFGWASFAPLGVGLCLLTVFALRPRPL